MTIRQTITLLGLLLVPCILSAQAKYPGPDSPAVEAAARAALPNAKILDIIGMTSGIQGVLQDLGAKVTDQEIRIELPSDVLFDFDQYSLRPEASVSLRKVAQLAAAYPNAALAIEGHTDSKGLHAHNMRLSNDRALSVRNWLAQNAGVPPARISTQGWGATRPTAPNQKPDGTDDPDGRQKNRRVEIVLNTRP